MNRLITIALVVQWWALLLWYTYDDLLADLTGVAWLGQIHPWAWILALVLMVCFNGLIARLLGLYGRNGQADD